MMDLQSAESLQAMEHSSKLPALKSLMSAPAKSQLSIAQDLSEDLKFLLTPQSMFMLTKPSLGDGPSPPPLLFFNQQFLSEGL